MEIPTAMTLSQPILVAALLAILLGWMIVFAILALRPTSKSTAEGISESADSKKVSQPMLANGSALARMVPVLQVMAGAQSSEQEQLVEA